MTNVPTKFDMLVVVWVSVCVGLMVRASGFELLESVVLCVCVCAPAYPHTLPCDPLRLPMHYNAPPVVSLVASSLGAR